MGNTKEIYAGFWKRYAASVIDGVIIIFFTYSLRSVISNSLAMDDSGIAFLGGQRTKIAFIIWSFYLFIVKWAYFAGLESSPLKATIGKLALGIYVVDINNERIDFGQASGRFFGKIISGAILGIGYLMAGFTDKKQALHDQMSKCLVLQK